MKKNLRIVANMVTMILVAILVGGCPDNPAGPTPTTPTASITCNGQANACVVDLWTKPVIAWTSANVSGCAVRRNGEALSDWGTSLNSSRQLDAQMTSGMATYAVECTGPNGSAIASVAVTVRSGRPAEFRISNGLTNTPVDARVTTIATSYQTRGDGSLTIDEAPSRFNVTIDAPGYLTYETIGSSDRTEYKLWPVNSPNSEDGIKQMVYGDSSAYNNPGLRAMNRIDGPVSFYFSAELATNQAVIGRYETGVPLLAAAIKNRWPLTVIEGTSPLSGTISVMIQIDSTISTAANTSMTYINGRAISGIIRFKTLDNLSDYYIRHENAHVVGLWHHEGEGLVGRTWLPSQLDYSPAEKGNMQMMVWVLPPGTIWPYNDRGAIGAKASGFTGTVTFRD
jgi:hypothetical protein